MVSPGSSLEMAEEISKVFFLLVLFVVVISAELGSAQRNGGRGGDEDTKLIVRRDFHELGKLRTTGQERVLCTVLRSRCFLKKVMCPRECPQKKPALAKKQKGCFIDCRRNCEATCKLRKANCEGFGSLCYDPRFVGGDGVMFYFHGSKNDNYAIVSDDSLHINAHFIGIRPDGRSRDFTWVQALAVMFESDILTISAKKVTFWDDSVDSLEMSWNGSGVDIVGAVEWKTMSSHGREVAIERTDVVNGVRVKVSGLVEIDVSVKPIGKKENEVHHYMLPDDDAFAHLETQFRFQNLSSEVEGVLGKTYRPEYVSPVKVGVDMPMMGGEDKYFVPSLLSSSCKVCRFNLRKEDRSQLAST